MTRWLSHQARWIVTFALSQAWLVTACGKASSDGEGASGGASNAAGGAGGASLAAGGTSLTTGGASASGVTYVKASNTGAEDRFGIATAISADGNTLVVGANREGSGAIGVNGDEHDESVVDAGAVYVFSRSEGSWEQVAYLKASNSGSGDGFGSSLALSADGNTLAIAAPFESSAVTGIDGDQSDDAAVSAGAVYLFVRSGTSWEQEAYLKASNTDRDDLFGYSVALSADGNVLSVGAEAEDGAGLGIDGDQNDKSAPEAGAVYVFARSEGSWQQRDYIKASNPDAFDHFGGSLALTADGKTLAVGAYWEDSAAAGIDGDSSDNSVKNSGAAYVFAYDGAAWKQAAYLKALPNDGSESDSFGTSVSLSADGSILAVGAAGDPSSATGINGDASGTSMPYAGAAYVFVREGSTYRQEAYLKAFNTGGGDEFGRHIQLSPSGDILAVGAAQEGSGPHSPQGDESAPLSGAVYLFGRDGAEWRQVAFTKAPNAEASDRFGWSVALSGEADTLVVGASRESSGATGINGDPSENGLVNAGAVYIYEAASFAGP